MKTNTKFPTFNTISLPPIPRPEIPIFLLFVFISVLSAFYFSLFVFDFNFNPLNLAVMTLPLSIKILNCAIKSFVLGAILFNIYFDAFYERLKTSGYHLKTFGFRSKTFTFRIFRNIPSLYSAI